MLEVSSLSFSDGKHAVLRDFSFCAECGEVIADDGRIVVACGEGAVSLLGVLPEGKGRMSAADFVRGRKIARGDILK